MVVKADGTKVLSISEAFTTDFTWPVGSPDGWLWTRIRPLALSRTASRNSSPIRTSDDATLPW